MRHQTELALDECDAALFVIDAREGVTPLDRIFAELVRVRNKPVVVFANKAEGRAGDHGAIRVRAYDRVGNQAVSSARYRYR